jgi:hypothetical protein
MSRWQEMSNSASRIWNAYLNDERLADTIFDQLEALLWIKPRHVDLEVLVARWRSATFRSQNGWDFRSRLFRVAKNVASRLRV